MIRFFLLNLFLLAHLSGNSILQIEEHEKEIEATRYISFIKDEKENLYPWDILKITDMETLKSKNHSGASYKGFWTKLTVQNNSNKKRDLVFYNERTRMNYLNVFIYKNNALIKKHALGDLIPFSQKEFPSRYALFKYTFEPYETITIITHLQNNALYNLSWQISNINDYVKHESIALLLWGLFAGVLLLASSFNLFMYKMHQQKGYLIIAIHCIIFLVYEYALNGVLYKLDLGYPPQWNITLFLNLGTLLITFLMIFPYYFFNTVQNYPKISRLIQLLLSFYLLIIVSLLYSQYIDQRLFSISIPILLWAYIVNSLVTLGIGIYMFKKKETGSLYYLVGQGLLALSLMIYIASMMTNFPYSTKTNSLLIIILMSDLFFLFIAQYIKTKQKQANLYRNKEVLMDQSRFSSIGQAIGNITHQWKHPLSQLGSSITLIEATLSHQKEKLEEKITSQLPNMNHAINLMQTTIDEFSSFYKTKRAKESFNVYRTICKVLEILKPKMMLNNVQTEVDINENFTLKSYEHIFSNIMLILIDNSLNAFKKSTKNMIHISVEQSKSKLILYYQDNAGGIKIHPVESVFEYFVSSNQDEKGQGMGLPILKMLVEERLNGYVKLRNSKEGVFFEIHIYTSYN